MDAALAKKILDELLPAGSAGGKQQKGKKDKEAAPAAEAPAAKVAEAPTAKKAEPAKKEEKPTAAAKVADKPALKEPEPQVASVTHLRRI
jgi:hypothetical protein